MIPSPSWLKACAACLWVAASVAHASDKVATITMLDGPAWVIHAATKLSAPEGAAVEAEDIVETSPTTPLLRMEFEDGTILDVGPSSRVMVWPKWQDTTGGSSVAYVLEGWAKVTMDKQPARSRSLLSTAALDLLTMGRDAVVRVQGRDTELFAESGDVSVQVRGKSAPAGTVKLPKGQFMARHGDAAAEVTARPQPGFIQAVPRPFMDTLPARASVFKGKRVALNPVAPLSYAETEGWLNAEPRVRARFPTRWKALAQDPAFRRSLAAKLSLHPEWASVLSPDKPASKPAALANPSTESIKP